MHSLLPHSSSGTESARSLLTRESLATCGSVAILVRTHQWAIYFHTRRRLSRVHSMLLLILRAVAAVRRFRARASTRELQLVSPRRFTNVK